MPIFYTVCLLSSSVTVHLAAKRLARGERLAFLALWLLTIVLGGLFIRHRPGMAPPDLRTRADDFHESVRHHLLLARWFHAFHVTVGLLMLAIVLGFGIAGRVRAAHSARVDVLSLYWHFVDAVWVVVFTVVYIIGR